MAWTTPNSSRTTGYLILPADWNNTQADLQYLFDNLNTVLPLASTLGAAVQTQETTTTTSYVDLATAGPAVTLTTAGHALVTLSCQGFNNTASDSAAMSFAISGATTLAAADNNSVVITSTSNQSGTMVFYVATTAGNNTFEAKYRAVTGGTATFLRRNITVMPLP
jgi:hypothetical protein